MTRFVYVTINPWQPVLYLVVLTAAHAVSPCHSKQIRRSWQQKIIQGAISSLPSGCHSTILDPSNEAVFEHRK